MKQAFHETCVVPMTGSPVFHPVTFPPKSFIETLVGLYIDSFHPVFPLLHLPSLSDVDTHWLLLLAIAAVGSHYLKFESSEVFAGSIHEFLQRVISPQASRYLAYQHKPH